MRTIVALRHAEPKSGEHNVCRGDKQDDELSDIGKWQTEENIRHINRVIRGKEQHVLLVTSPLQRAKFFGERMSVFPYVEHQIDTELTDIDVGDWGGKTWEYIDKQWPLESHLCWTDARKLEIPGAQETIAAFEERVLRRLKYWVQQSPEKLLAFCIHKCSLKVMLDHIARRQLTFTGQSIGCMNEVEVDILGDELSGRIIQEDRQIWTP